MTRQNIIDSYKKDRNITDDYKLDEDENYLIGKIEAVINYTRCCETLKDEGQATLTEYATELINMQENPQDSNKDWKIIVIQNTIGKLYKTLQTI